MLAVEKWAEHLTVSIGALQAFGCPDAAGQVHSILHQAQGPCSWRLPKLTAFTTALQTSWQAIRQWHG